MAHELLLLLQTYPQATLVSLLLVCPLLVVVLVRRFATTSTATSARDRLLSKLPSPPGKLPIIGHLHLVGSLPHVSLRDLAAEHGRDGLLLLRLGAVPTLVVSSPAAAQAVLRTHDHVFASRTYSAITDILFYGSSDVAFSPYGEHWRQVRKIATMHLLTNRKVRSYRHAREQEVRLVMAKIREAAEAGTAMNLTDLLNSFANDIVCLKRPPRTLVPPVSSKNDIVCHAVSGKFFREEGRNKLFQELVESNTSLLGGFNLVDYFPIFARQDIVRKILCYKAHKVNKIWDNLLNKLIDDHASKPELLRHGEESDFIDVLLSIQHEYKLTRDHIKAQLVVMLQAGTDSSSTVLEYAIVELMRHPHLMTKLQAEVRMAIPKGKEMVTEDDLNGMAYLKAVIKETLRLHGSAPLLVPHFSMADCNIEGYTIPSGTRTIVNAWALAMDPSYWDSPEEFMPERFMEAGSAAAMDYMGNDFLYLPFGSGRRKCPGINFAILAVEVMLANLMYHFNWKLPSELLERGIDMKESFGVTVHRIEKLLLVPVIPQE
ncbi:hypothetical protein ACP70R_003490 [Stipagrostis hirtigluma subsp. patula]